MPAGQISVHRKLKIQTKSYQPRKTPTLRPAVTMYQVSPADLRTLNCWQCWHTNPEGASPGMAEVAASATGAGCSWSTVPSFCSDLAASGAGVAMAGGMTEVGAQGEARQML